MPQADHLDAVQPQDLLAHERPAIHGHAGVSGHHAVAAGEDPGAADVPHQIRLGNSLVQHMSDQEKDPVVHSSLSKQLFIWSALLVLSLAWGL